MNKTKYNEIINGEQTYNEIVDKLKQNIPVVIGWTDEDYTPCLLLLIPTYSLCFELHQSGSYTPFEYPKQKE